MSDAPKVTPFSLKDAPALIERLFPAQKISAEAQKERKAGAGQTLTALGSYWKGRKPLVLVRACILGALLPATDNPEKDLEIFEMLLAIDDGAFERRVKRRAAWPDILGRSYLDRLEACMRPEELPTAAYDTVWRPVNQHLGTHAASFAELVEQLGVMRFGRRPIVADAFAGGGSIPFEAARLGCDVLASDLNPIACMLSWAAYHVIGANADNQASISEARLAIQNAVEALNDEFQHEIDEEGLRVKAYLYCLEARCPDGWIVPLSPTWVISTKTATVARLVPDAVTRTFRIDIVSNVSAEELRRARVGTVQSEHVVYAVGGEQRSWSISSIRGDRRSGGNDLRIWDRLDVASRADDLFRERLYCLQVLGAEPSTVHYRAPTESDHHREAVVEAYVRSKLPEWMALGLVPDVPIEPGVKTSELIRTRGWSHWHHLFAPRQLLLLARIREATGSSAPMALAFANALNFMSKLCGIHPRTLGSGREMCLDRVFINQALNTLWNYGVRSGAYLPDNSSAFPVEPLPKVNFSIRAVPASEFLGPADLVVTDPPYADAVVYDEITEYFIAWMCGSPPKEWSDWVWDSRRRLAIRGQGEAFRQGMIEAYGKLCAGMSDNGLQIVMFTHQSSEVWGDMAQIFWGAGLRVMAAWYIATETTSELKKGGYVQGTVILVLRKRLGELSGYKNEVVEEVKEEVARQIETMVGLNQSLRGHGRIENLFEDADLQMAGYAAALRVLTGYTRIDGRDMVSEALRPRQKGEKGLVGEIIEYAVQVANEHMVPEGMSPRVWERLVGAERFYLKMVDVEATGAKKLETYENFGKAFQAGNHQVLMQSTKPNAARLKSGAELKGMEFGDSEFGRSLTRAVLFALYELGQDIDGDKVLGHLRDLVADYNNRRDDLAEIAAYLAMKREGTDAAEASGARVLHGLIRNERLGG